MRLFLAFRPMSATCWWKPIRGVFTYRSLTKNYPMALIRPVEDQSRPVAPLLPPAMAALPQTPAIKAFENKLVGLWWAKARLCAGAHRI